MRSESKAAQVFALPFEVFHGVVEPHVVSLAQAVEPHSEAEEPPQLGFRDVAALVFLKRQRFEGAAGEIAAVCAESGGQIVGDVN